MCAYSPQISVGLRAGLGNCRQHPGSACWDFQFPGSGQVSPRFVQYNSFYCIFVQLCYSTSSLSSCELISISVKRSGILSLIHSVHLFSSKLIGNHRAFNRLESPIRSNHTLLPLYLTSFRHREQKVKENPEWQSGKANNFLTGHKALQAMSPWDLTIWSHKTRDSQCMLQSPWQFVQEAS